MIRVLLVDDHLSFRQPLAFMLLREPDITIIGQAATVAEARPLLPEADIALIDLDLPDEEGLALIQELQAVNPTATAVMLLTMVPAADAQVSEDNPDFSYGVRDELLAKGCRDPDVASYRRLNVAGRPLLCGTR